MRVLLLNANRVGVGTYFRAYYFGRELAKRGHEAVLLTVSNTHRFRSAAREDESGLRVTEMPNFLDEWLPWHASGPLDIVRRTAAAVGGPYDVIYAFEYQPNVSVPAVAGRWLRGRALISDWCDWHAGASYYFGGKSWAHRIDRFFEEFIRHRADHLTVINHTLRDRALSIGIPVERITVIPEGVDPDYIRPLDRDEMRGRLGLPLDTVIVGTIRDSLAGAELLIRAIRELEPSRPNIRLLIVGRTPSSFLGLAHRLGLGDRMILPGRVSDDDLPRYLACADVLALPLEDNLINRGRWPHKLGDLVAAARPVLVSVGGEFPQMLGARGCAWVLPFDAVAYAEAISALLCSPHRAAELARRGRDLIVKELNWDRIGVEVAAVVERVVVGR